MPATSSYCHHVDTGCLDLVGSQCHQAFFFRFTSGLISMLIALCMLFTFFVAFGLG